MWELGTNERFGLPQHIDAVQFFGAAPTEGPLFAVVTPDEAAGTFDACVVDALGRQYLEVKGYRTVAFSAAAGPELLRPFRTALQKQLAAVAQ